MTSQDPKQKWATYCTNEIAFLTPILAERGITLEHEQPHIAGERYLMQAVTTTHGKKIILLGKTKDGMRVIIKATRDPNGKKEMAHERACRQLLEKINFARDVFHSPRELHQFTQNTCFVTVTEFIEQDTSFIERPLETQYQYALSVFHAQEGAHATTWSHIRQIKKTFAIRNSHTYLNNFSTFKAQSTFALPQETSLIENLEKAFHHLQENVQTIEQYTGFLTHTDFVPHNIRIKDGRIYLLDHSSLVFGNKYESWARFINFMTLYNPPLAQALITYVVLNRTPEETIALRMLRIYRLGEIITYYINATHESVGDLRILNTERIHFWNTILEYVRTDRPVPEYIINTYKQKRDLLRSEDEKKRQQGLH